LTVVSQWNGKDVLERAKKLAQQGPFAIGLAVEGQAKLLCPVALINGGRLRGSIITKSGTGKQTQMQLPASGQDEIKKPNESNEVYVGTAVHYGPYQEYGTIKMNAQPFLRPALDYARGKAPQIVMREGKAAFGEYLNPKQPSERELFDSLGITE